MLRYSRNGDIAAFEVLLKRYQNQLFGFLIQSCRSRDRAEDLYQETFFRVVRSAGNYKTSASFRTWLFTIARNLLIDEHRKTLTRPQETRTKNHDTNEFIDSTIVSETPDAERIMRSREIRETIQSALASLPEQQREMFLLRENAGLDFKEAARITACSVNTAKSRMRYALLRIREKLEQSGLIPEETG
ncbi:sigma-70 family RNA polymerase sigma factor [bacterium]|nr:sigma-70 family RNA polymerase sigma factor [bacterium]